MNFTNNSAKISAIVSSSLCNTYEDPNSLRTPLLKSLSSLGSTSSSSTVSQYTTGSYTLAAHTSKRSVSTEYHTSSTPITQSDATSTSNTASFHASKHSATSERIPRTNLSPVATKSTVSSTTSTTKGF